MLRFLSRTLGYWLIAAAIVAAVIDGAKSIAASALVTTPVAETSATLSALSGGGSPGIATSEFPWPLDAVLPWLLSAPTTAVLGVLGFLFLAAGRKRRRTFIGREYAA